MEKEQIVKALECCAATSAEACRECPVDQSIKDDCRCCSFLAGNALGIIREQEKRIAEFSATQDFVSIDAVRDAIKRYCHKLIDEDKNFFEVTEFNANIQRFLGKEVET